MKIVKPAHKGEGTPKSFLKVVHLKMIDKATRVNKQNNKLRFGETRYILGAIYRIPKPMHFRFLKAMEEVGLIEVRPYHDVVLKVKSK